MTDVSLHDTQMKAIDARTARIGVVGLGYVGLPLALSFCEKGFTVVGLDVDDRKVSALTEGRSYIKHISHERLQSARKDDRLTATTDFGQLANIDAVLIAVPTPLTPQREPEMRYIVETTERIKEHLKRGQLIVLESTTYPGTTDGLMLDILEKSGLKMGTDFFLAYSPEREDPGNPKFDTTSIPKVVGGVDELSATLAVKLYESITSVVAVSSARAAEATKLTENIFRAVNIALVNELKVVYERMGIDVWDVLDAASTKPFGFMRFNPGPGLGGHCIPLDPFYLTWKAREYGVATRFIELAGEVNVSMPRYVVDKVQEALNERSKSVRGSKVLILGLAYKKNVDDVRESPAFELASLLLERGAKVDYHDPHVPAAPTTRNWPHLGGWKSVPLTAENLAGYDAVLIATDHDEVDYSLVAEKAELVIDTRGALRGLETSSIKASVVKA